MKKANGISLFRAELVKAATSGIVQLEESKRIDTILESRSPYSKIKMETKMEKDLNFMNELCDKYISETVDNLVDTKHQGLLTESESVAADSKIVKLSEDGKDFKQLFESLMVDTLDLYQEINENAGFYIQTLDPLNRSQFNKFKDTLTESEENTLYFNKFNKAIQNNFITPINENTLYTKYNDKIQNVMNTLLTIEENHLVDKELLVKYAIFESVIIDEIKNIYLPDAVQSNLKVFEESLDEDYFTMYDRNSRSIMESIDLKMEKIGGVIAPKIFNVLFEESALAFDPEILSGSSKLLKTKDERLALEESYNLLKEKEDAKKQAIEEAENLAKQDLANLELLDEMFENSHLFSENDFEDKETFNLFLEEANTAKLKKNGRGNRTKKEQLNDKSEKVKVDKKSKELATKKAGKLEAKKAGELVVKTSEDKKDKTPKIKKKDLMSLGIGSVGIGAAVGGAKHVVDKDKDKDIDDSDDIDDSTGDISEMFDK